MADHTHFMEEALQEAEKAYLEEEVPIGAVVVFGNRIIGRAHNRVRSLKDPTAHAEILALREAARALNNERLLKSMVYVTIEPCPMCMGALIWARVEELIYGASDPKAGACNHHLKITKGVLEDKSRSLLQRFFLERRGGTDGD